MLEPADEYSPPVNVEILTIEVSTIIAVIMKQIKMKTALELGTA